MIQLENIIFHINTEISDRYALYGIQVYAKMNKLYGVRMMITMMY